MKKKLLSLLLALSIIVALGSAAFADESGFILDMDNVIWDEEPLELLAQEIFDKYGIAVIYVSVAGLDGMTGPEYAQRLASQYISQTDAAVLLDCREDACYYLYYVGRADDVFDDGDDTLMMSAFDRAQTYDEGVRAYLNRADEILSRKTPATRDLVLLEDNSQTTESDAAVETGILDNLAADAPLLSLTDGSSQQPAQNAAPTIPQERQLPLVVDTAGVVDPSYIQQLNQYAEQISNNYKCDVAVAFVASTGSKSAQAFADDFYDYNGYGYGSGDDGILLMVAVQDRSFAVTTYGSAGYTFTDYGQLYMDEQYLPYLKNNDWGGAAKAFIAASEQLLEYEAKNGRPFDVNNQEPERDVVGSLLFSLLGGFVLGFIPISVMKRKMLNVQPQSDARDYVRKGSFDLSRRHDRFITSQIARTPIPKNTDNNRGGGMGGGSSFHVSSSGRTHGGHSGRF